MPIPTPNKKTEDKSSYMHRCMGNKNMQEYKQDQRVAICLHTWTAKRAKADLVVSAAGNEFISGPNIELSDEEVAKIKAEYYRPFNKNDAPSIYGPEGPETK